MKPTRYVLILSICMLLLAVPGCDFAFPAAEGRFQRSLDVTGPVDLEIMSGSGRIDVRSGGSAVVQITGLIRAGNDWRSNTDDKIDYLQANPPIVQSGNTIRIGRIAQDEYRSNVSISYEIVVPAESQVRATTGSGSIKIEGVRRPAEAHTGSGSIEMYSISERVTAHTGSGGIKLDQINSGVEAQTGSGSILADRIAGSVRLQTGSGGITLQQTAGGARDTDVQTSSGHIEISGVNGSLRAHSSSGGITVSGQPAGDWELEASSGHVTLHLDANASFDLTAHTGSGGITVDHPIAVTGTVTRHDMRGKVRSGGHRVDIRTRSGGVTIR